MKSTLSLLMRWSNRLWFTCVFHKVLWSINLNDINILTTQGSIVLYRLLNRTSVIRNKEDVAFSFYRCKSSECNDILKSLRRTCEGSTNDERRWQENGLHALHRILGTVLIRLLLINFVSIVYVWSCLMLCVSGMDRQSNIECTHRLLTITEMNLSIGPVMRTSQKWSNRKGKKQQQQNFCFWQWLPIDTIVVEYQSLNE